MSGQPNAPSQIDLSTFRSRRGQAMAGALAALCTSLFIALAVFLPTATWDPPDRVFIAMIGLGISLCLLQWALVKAVPSEAGLRVRNLLGARMIRWSEIREVTFPDGEAWASIHLYDTDIVAVMAIQRADGEDAHQQARRLAALVAHFRR